MCKKQDDYAPVQAQGCRTYGRTAKEPGGAGRPQIVASSGPVPLASVSAHHSTKATVDNAAEKQNDRYVESAHKL